jgi:8-amino-7-oxononanoate synthase
MSYEARIRAKLDDRKRRKVLRTLDPVLQGDTSSLIDFSSNDYLSFSRAPELRKGFSDRLRTTEAAFGPPSSRLLDGNSAAHLELEHRLASFFCADAALLFNSGFDANAGLWACLPGETDYIVYDELIHASVHDGMRASRARGRLSFRHNNVVDLRRILERLLEADPRLHRGTADVWLSVEALYSMDGDLAPLEAYAALLDELFPSGNAHLTVDEVRPNRLCMLPDLTVCRPIRADCTASAGAASPVISVSPSAFWSACTPLASRWRAAEVRPRPPWLICR